MRCLTSEEVGQWCATHGLSVTGEGYVRFDSDEMRCFTVGLEEKASRTIALADHLLPTWEGVPFQGALLWIRERGVWGDHSEATASQILKQMRLAAGEVGTLDQRPGHLFGPAEQWEAHSYLVVPLLFGWDAFLFPEGKDYFLFVSHDGVAEVVSRTSEAFQQLYQQVKSWGPKEDETWYPGLARR